MLQNHYHKKYLCLKAKKKGIVSSLLCFIELDNQDLKITKKKKNQKTASLQCCSISRYNKCRPAVNSR